MILAAKILIAIASVIYLWLCAAHMAITFLNDKLYPSQKETIKQMKADHMNLTRSTSVWNVWIGFNASHSLGGIFLGAVNMLLLFLHPEVSLSWPVLALNILTSLAYVIVAKKYWFKTPFIGVLIATVCFVGALFLQLA